MKEYKIELCGVERTLPFIPINDTTAFASFVVLGDTELVSACAPELVKRIGQVDAVVTACLLYTSIPARWQSGLTAEPDFCGAHDWVQFYVAPYGWLYADTSYGIAAVRAGDEERRRFYFGNIDVYKRQRPWSPAI